MSACETQRPRVLNRWTAEKTQTLVRVYGTCSSREIGQMLGVSREAVKKKAVSLGLSCSNPSFYRFNRPTTGELEIAPGHFAVDRRSFELLQRAMEDR